MIYIKVILSLFFITTILSAQEITKKPFFADKTNEHQLNKNPQVLNIFANRMLDSVITTSSAGGYRNPQYKHTFTYNSNGSLAIWFTQTVYGNQQNVQLLTYEYNSNNKITSILSKKWDRNEWANVFRVTNTYDSSITELQQQWDASSNSWANYIRKIKSSNASRVQLGQIWDWSLNDWKDDWRETKEYEGEDLIYSISEIWFQDAWKKNSKIEYTFDTRGNLVKDSYKTWTGDDWWLYYKYTYAMRDGIGPPDGNDEDTTYITSYKYKSYAQTLVEDERQTCVYGKDDYLSSCFNEIYDRFSGWRDGYSSVKFTDSFGNEFTFSGFLIEFYYDTPTYIVDESLEISDYTLSQNYPNPFNPSTTISFELPQKSEVNLTIYNTLGQVVATLVNEIRQAGKHQIVFDASDLPNGVYIYRIKAGSYTSAKKMILLK